MSSIYVFAALPHSEALSCLWNISDCNSAAHKEPLRELPVAPQTLGKTDPFKKRELH